MTKFCKFFESLPLDQKIYISNALNMTIFSKKSNLLTKNSNSFRS